MGWLAACAQAKEQRFGDADAMPEIDAGCVPTAEICDGIDNDCDGLVDEGFNVGMPCDGPDSDACNEGVIACDGAGGTTCTDHTGDNIELCNGIDDDCKNGIDDPFPVGQACSVGL